MSKPSNFRHYDLDQATRKTLGINTFAGVDYSSQRFLVADGRAIDMRNFIYKDGVLQKRNGAEHLFDVDTFNYAVVKFDNTSELLYSAYHTNKDNKTINGVWNFVAEDGESHVIAHIGKLLYELKEIDTDFARAEPITFGQLEIGGALYKTVFEFEDFKSMAFVGGNKLWFLGGNKYMCIRFLADGSIKVIPLEDSDFTPVPTTTISITYSGAQTEGRESYDSVNVLTMFRKNAFITGVGKKETELTKTTFYEYTLDAPIVYKKASDMAKVTFTLEEIGEVEE